MVTIDHGSVESGVVTTSAAVKTGRGRCIEFVVTTGDRVWTLYDNTSGSGTKIAVIAANANVPYGATLSTTFDTGIYANTDSGTSGTLTVTHT